MDNVAFEVDGALVVRFSKRPDPVLVRHEAAVLAVAARVAPVPVPSPVLVVPELGCLAYRRLRSILWPRCSRADERFPQLPTSTHARPTVDLSTDLSGLLPLVAPLISGHSDVAIGSRLLRGARVGRGPQREFISRSYNLFLRTVLGVGFSDAQCGFKAVRRDAAQQLLSGRIPVAQVRARFGRAPLAA